MARTQYNTFGGVDIKAVIGPYVLATLQAISYSIVREKVPVYVMGRVSPMSFGRGKRAIAGSMIFITFDAHPILNDVFEIESQAKPEAGKMFTFYADVDEIGPAKQERATSFDSKAVPSQGLAEKPNFPNDSDLRTAYYVDQLMPFDIVLVAMNEVGTKADMRILGAELLNEGWGISIDDVASETQYTYVAKDVWHWKPRSGSVGLVAEGKSK